MAGERASAATRWDASTRARGAETARSRHGVPPPLSWTRKRASEPAASGVPMPPDRKQEGMNRGPPSCPPSDARWRLRLLRMRARDTWQQARASVTMSSGGS